MIVFIDDIKINIKKAGSTVKHSKYSAIFSTGDFFELSTLSSNILFLHPKPDEIIPIIHQLEDEKREICCIDIITEHPKSFLKQIFSDYKVIKAGGGVVNNNKDEIAELKSKLLNAFVKQDIHTLIKRKRF